jgi:hypothetical protein
MPDDDQLPLWKPSGWKVGRTDTASTSAGGGPVECPTTGEFGYHKRTFVGREKVAADLARLIGVPVPEFRLGRLEGHAGTIGVSIAHGAESMDLPMLESRVEGVRAAAPMKTALRRASGLLALHTWVKTEDLKDEHLLVAGDGVGGYRVAAIDFSYGWGWASPTDAVEGATGPPALILNFDKDEIDRAITAIETCSDDTIRKILEALPGDAMAADERRKVVEGLIARRGRVREAARQKGWLP